MTDQVVFWRGDYLANKILEQQDRIDELERKIAAQSRTIRVLSEALVLSADTVDVPALADFMGLVDVREEVGS